MNSCDSIYDDCTIGIIPSCVIEYPYILFISKRFFVSYYICPAIFSAKNLQPTYTEEPIIILPEKSGITPWAWPKFQLEAPFTAAHFLVPAVKLQGCRVVFYQKPNSQGWYITENDHLSRLPGKRNGSLEDDLPASNTFLVGQR